MCIRDRLTSDHNPTLVHVATQHGTVRDKSEVIEWDRYGPALCRRLPPAGPIDTVRLIDEAVAGIDEAIISAVDMSSLPTPELRNFFRKRWQRKHDPPDKAAYNWLTGRLRGSLMVFRRGCWELAVAGTGDADPQSHPYRKSPAKQ